MDPLVRNVILAERFGVTPLEVESGDTDRWLMYIQVMGIEGDFIHASEGVPREEPVFREGDV